MSEHEDAKKIVEFIKGTAIADLRSQVNWVRDSRTGKVPPPTDGQLNFALALLALIVCESCGFYMLGASKTPNDFEKGRADLGTYVMEFIQDVVQDSQMEVKAFSPLEKGEQFRTCEELVGVD